MEFDVVSSPKFFFAGDLLIDVFSAITLFIIAFYSYKLLCQHRKTGISCDYKNIKLLSAGLFIFGASFIVDMALDAYLILFEIANSAVAVQHIFLSFTSLEIMCIFAGYFLYHLLTFAGIILIYFVAFKQDSTLSKLLVASLLFFSLLFLNNSSHYAFYLLTCLMLSIIALKYFAQYQENKNVLTARIALSFGLLSLSYFMFLLAEFDPLVYVVTKVIWLCSFILLFVSFSKLMYYGKKKK